MFVLITREDIELEDSIATITVQYESPSGALTDTLVFYEPAVKLFIRSDTLSKETSYEICAVANVAQDIYDANKPLFRCPVSGTIYKDLRSR